MPRSRLGDLHLDMTKPFIRGHFYCSLTNKLYRAHLLLIYDVHQRELLDLIQRANLPYPGRAQRLRSTVVFTMQHGSTIVTSASYNLMTDELVDVRTHTNYRRRGLSTKLLEFVCMNFAPRYITARASPGLGAPTSVLLNYYSRFGYQLLPNSDRFISMTRIAEIKEMDRASDDEQSTNEEEVAGVMPLDSDESLALQAIGNSSNRTAVTELNNLYRLLHEPNSANVAALLAAQSIEPSALITAVSIYDQEWFDSQPWAVYHKAEFAMGMSNLLKAHTGRTNSLWTKLASST